MKEEWATVSGTNGFYKVSNFGRIKSYVKKVRDVKGVIRGFQKGSEGKILQGSIAAGYKVIDYKADVSRSTIYVHRAVAENFIPNPENKPEINHKDGDKLNNHVNNLEWVTHKENMEHAIDTGLFNNKGETHSSAKLTKTDVLEIRAAYRLGCFDYHDLSDAYGTSVDNIRHIIKRRSWKHI